jgi:hypothetical protein
MAGDPIRGESLNTWSITQGGERVRLRFKNVAGSAQQNLAGMRALRASTIN